MRILKNRNFSLLFCGQLVSTFGNNLYSLALPWYIYSVTHSKNDLALAGIAVYIPWIAGLFVGVFVDRWLKRRTMIATDGLRAILAGFIFAAVVLHWPFPFLLLLVFCLEFFGAFFSPAASALLPLIVEKDELSSAMGMRQSGESSAQLTGLITGGGLMAVLGAAPLFLANAISFALSAISLIFIRVEERIVRKEQSSAFFHDWMVGIRAVFRSKTILRLICIGMVINFAAAPLQIIMIAWMQGPLQENSFTLGLVQASDLLGMLVGGLLLHRIMKKMEAFSAVRSGLIAAGVCIAMIGLIPHAWWTISVMLLGGLSIAIVNGSLNVMLVDVVPHSMRGRIFGTFNSLLLLTAPLGIVLSGTLMAIFPIKLMFVFIGSLCALGGVSFFVPYRNDVDQLDASIEA